MAASDIAAKEAVSPNSGFLRRIYDYFFGYEYFLAHRSVDGKQYTQALYDALTRKKFDCFLDIKHYQAGNQLDTLQRRALKKTRRLIVVVTPHAHDADSYLLKEIEEFRRFHPEGERLIIPIGTTESLTNESHPSSPLLERIPHLPNTLCIIEDAKALERGCPSDKAVEKLLNDFNETRSATRRLRWMTLVAMVSSLFAISAVLFGMKASDSAVAASKSAASEAKERTKAQEAQEKEEFARKEAELNAREALLQKQAAIKNAAIAQEQRKLADGQASNRAYELGCAQITDGNALDALRSLLSAVRSDKANLAAGNRLINLLSHRTSPVRVAILHHLHPVRAVRVHQKAGVVAVVTADALDSDGMVILHLYRLPTMELLGTAHHEGARSGINLEMSPDGNRFLMSSIDRHDSWAVLMNGSGKVLVEADQSTKEQINKSHEAHAVVSDGMVLPTQAHFCGGSRWLVDDVLAKDGTTVLYDIKEYKQLVLENDDVELSRQAVSVLANKVYELRSDGTLACYSAVTGKLLDKRSMLESLNADKNFADDKPESFEVLWARHNEARVSVEALVQWVDNADQEHLAFGCWSLAGFKKICWVNYNSESFSVSVDSLNAGPIPRLINGDRFPLPRLSSIDQYSDGNDAERGRSEDNFFWNPLQVSLDGRITVASNERVTIVDDVGKIAAGVIQHTGTVIDAAVSDETLISGADNGEVIVSTIIPSAGQRLAHSIDGRWTVARVGSAAETLYSNSGLWQLLFELNGTVFNRLSDGKRMAVNIDVNSSEPHPAFDIEPHQKSFSSAVLHGFSDFRAGYGIELHTLPETQGEIAFHFAPHSEVDALAYSPNGDLLASLGGGQIRVWETDGLRPLRTFSHADVANMSWRADSRHFVSWSVGGVGRVWDIESIGDKPTRTFVLKKTGEGLALDGTGIPILSADGSTVAVPFGERFLTFNVETGQPECDPVACGALIHRLQFVDEAGAVVRVLLCDGRSVEHRLRHLTQSLSDDDVAVLHSLVDILTDGKNLPEELEAMNGDRTFPIIKNLLSHFRSHLDKDIFSDGAPIQVISGLTADVNIGIEGRNSMVSLGNELRRLEIKLPDESKPLVSQAVTEWERVVEQYLLRLLAARFMPLPKPYVATDFPVDTISDLPELADLGILRPKNRWVLVANAVNPISASPANTEQTTLVGVAAASADLQDWWIRGIRLLLAGKPSEAEQWINKAAADTNAGWQQIVGKAIFHLAQGKSNEAEIVLRSLAAGKGEGAEFGKPLLAALLYRNSVDQSSIKKKTTLGGSAFAEEAATLLHTAPIDSGFLVIAVADWLVRTNESRQALKLMESFVRLHSLDQMGPLNDMTRCALARTAALRWKLGNRKSAVEMCEQVGYEDDKKVPSLIPNDGLAGLLHQDWAACYAEGQRRRLQTQQVDNAPSTQQEPPAKPKLLRRIKDAFTWPFRKKKKQE